MNIEESSRIRCGLLTLHDHLYHLGLLLWQQLWSPAADASFVASGFKSRPHFSPAAWLARILQTIRPSALSSGRPVSWCQLPL